MIKDKENEFIVIRLDVDNAQGESVLAETSSEAEGKFRKKHNYTGPLLIGVK